MKNIVWWKWLTVALLAYTILAGFLMPVPKLPILHESIRNLYFHVPMWFGMIGILGYGLFHSIKYLQSFDLKYDVKAREAVNTGILLGILGLSTGSLWARFTWGTWWVNDAKLNGAAITMLIYLAYQVLRNSLEDAHQKAKLAAVYNIFAYVMLIVFLMIYPRLNSVDSLHPGNGGNPGFSAYESDLSSSMRLVFYPAVIGWIMLASWITQVKIRLTNLEDKLND